MKKILLSAVLLFISGVTFCQTFMHGAGITVFISSARGSDVSYSQGVTYSPRLNFVETEDLSVSVGIPLTLGLSAAYSTTDGSGYYDEGTVGLILNVPLMVNLNMGRGSTKENKTKYGYFLGGGFGYHHGDFIVMHDDYSTTMSSNIYGPCANGGFRIGVGSAHKNIEIRLSYMKGVNETKPDIFGIGGAFNF